jgi:hypothetical protein
MQGIYNYISETNRVFKVHTVKKKKRNK